MCKKLSTDNIISIYDFLVKQFKDDSDPIQPAGLRNKELLESAVYRQYTGFNDELKYPQAIPNAMTLLYGICMNHCFLNGNKRTALVSGLVHLNENGVIPSSMTEDDLYDLIKALAGHNLLKLKDKDSKKIIKVNFRKYSSLTPDQEVFFLERWFIKKTKTLSNIKKSIRYRTLKKRLTELGCIIDVSTSPKKITITRIKKRKFFSKKELSITIPYCKENTIVNPTTLKTIRAELELDSENGYGDDAFFESTYIVDDVVQEYKNVLKRLSKT